MRGDTGLEQWTFLSRIEDGVYVVDTEGYITYANPAWLAMLGMQERAVLGRRVKDVLWDYSFSAQCISPGGGTDQDSSQRRGIWRQVLETGEKAGCFSEDECRCTVGYPIRDESGALTHVCVLEQDLTQCQHRLAAAAGTQSGEQETMIGGSAPMERVRRLIREVAATDATVMIIGETGVGKEVAAGEIQRLSRRSAAPFIRINCAAIPETLLESELFGYEAGAFTGAARGGKIGLLEKANHGTVLFDEIGELPLTMQPKLLRAIQERVIFRIGGSEAIPIDIRVLSATNRNLLEMVAQKQFREDLYYRLNIIPLRLPPLRKREGDVILLAEDFLRKCNERNGKHKYFTERAKQVLLNYSWPGNIRELRNLVDRLVILGASPRITEGDVRAYLWPQESEGAGEAEQNLSLQDATDQFQRQLISSALSQYGSTYKAAAALRTSQSTLSRKARQLGIDTR